ncbi:MAG: recombinase family protein [Chloroflexi bacterium]|nr:recombinase family protein [Chloroflexota bacterium]
MRAAGYFRVSDEDQLEGYSLDAQRRAFYEFCAQKGWEVVRTYDEEGRSAWGESTAKRPTFRQILADAVSDVFDVVITHALDRFSRNFSVMLDTFQIFSQNNVTYVSITQDIDYTTPEGRLFMTMPGAFAQYFSDTLSGHTRKGCESALCRECSTGSRPSDTSGAMRCATGLTRDTLGATWRGRRPRRWWRCSRGTPRAWSR